MSRRPVDRDSKPYRLGYAMGPWVGVTVLVLALGTIAWIIWGGH